MSGKMKINQVRLLFRDILSELLYQVSLTKSRKGDHRLLNIITLHRVLPEDLRSSYPIYNIAITPEELSWLLEVLNKYYNIGTLSENLYRWKDRKPTERPLLSITFDDGQLDNFLYAKPILEAAGICASFFPAVKNIESKKLIWHDRMAYAFANILSKKDKSACQLLTESGIVVSEKTPHEVIIDLLKKAKMLAPEQRLAYLKKLEDATGELVYPEWAGMMDWYQLKELVQGGHEIGSHSMTHPILPLCSDNEISNEVNQSRIILQDQLNIPVKTFCYPNGDYNGKIISVLQKAGYTQAVTTRWGPNNHKDSLFTLRRCDIQSKDIRLRNGKLSVSRLMWRLSKFHPLYIKSCG
ncbi:MAG: polysaccharide deacetylase family protein [Candidatus Electrothrix sp. AW3_4]|nr:polysaccharide deacetylase family protein [Candidatus Electrothrix gigas]